MASGAAQMGLVREGLEKQGLAAALGVTGL
jgi:hypothetical protein